MRWVAVITVAVFMMSVQCLSACTLAACMQTHQAEQMPSCHHHHKAPAQPAPPHTTCDHQKIANTPDNAALLIVWNTGPVPFTISLRQTPLASATLLPLGSPPGLARYFILRI